MEFSQLHKHSGPACEWSPDGNWLATADRTRLHIRTPSLEVVRTLKCADIISRFEWSPDSRRVLCVVTKKSSLVQVWSLNEPDWSCRIDQSAAGGLVHAMWAPCSQHIVAFSEHKLRASVWSLHSKDVVCVQSPKFSNQDGFKFSHDGTLAIVAERREGKDLVGLYSTETWEMLRHFAVDSTDLRELLWAPDDSCIAVVDSPMQHAVYVYTPDGRRLAGHTAYSDQLGIRTAAWSPVSEFLALGSYDQATRLIASMTWKPLGELRHSEVVEDARAVVYCEVPQDELDPSGPTEYVLEDTPATVPQVPVDESKPDPKIGVGLLKWSACGRYLLTRNDNMPGALWVWDAWELRLTALLKQAEAVKSARWDPTKPRLAICTGSGKLHMWAAEGCYIVQVPLEPINVRGMRWSPDGDRLVLMDKSRFCVVSFTPRDEEDIPS